MEDFEADFEIDLGKILSNQVIQQFSSQIVTIFDWKDPKTWLLFVALIHLH